MADETEKFAKDSRPSCKYGHKCYQKNPEHIKKYKHPLKHKENYGQLPHKIKEKLSITPTMSKERVSVSPKKVERVKESPPKKYIKLDNDMRCSTSPKQEKEKTNESVCDPNEGTSTSNLNVSSDSSNNLPVKICIPEDIATFIKDRFLVDMPEDFWSFWEYSKSISRNTDVKNAFKSVNLFMIGPFDVLLNSLPEKKKLNNYLLHWRYFYDPPEFQSILMTPGTSGFHMGYYRDSPSSPPSFVASNEVEKSCKITPVAENIFGAVMNYLETTKKKSPFTSIACQKLIASLKEWANKHNFTLDTHTSSMKKRLNAAVAKTFHGAGIVVPYDKRTQLGYRPLIETDAKLKLLISNVIDAQTEADKDKALGLLQPIITMANIATDECDFGTGLELGINFFCTGEKVFHNSIKQLLGIAYSMLNRNEFDTIINVHLDNRRKGANLSCGELCDDYN